MKNSRVQSSFVMPDLIRHPEIYATDKTLDSGFRRNDGNEAGFLVISRVYETLDCTVKHKIT